MEVLSLKAMCPLRVPGDQPRQACHQVTQHPPASQQRQAAFSTGATEVLSQSP